MENCIDQIKEAYCRMAKEALYRPEASGDGMGNITVPLERLNLENEAHNYSQGCWRQEDSLRFWVGCCNFETRPATIFAVEAARCLCSAADEVALKLLKMAVADLEARCNKKRNRSE